MRRLLIPLVLVAGCAEAPPENAYLHLDISTRAGDHEHYLTAARTWEALGFEVGDVDANLPTCEPHERAARCQLTVTLDLAPYLSQTDGLAIIIDSREPDPGRVRIAIAHEAGHVLLDTGDHAPGGQLAVMAGTWSEVTDVDRVFACAHVAPIGC